MKTFLQKLRESDGEVGTKKIKKLKCPFCGGKAVDSYYGELRYVACSKCWAKGPTINVIAEPSRDNRISVNKAIIAWNKRAES